MKLVKVLVRGYSLTVTDRTNPPLSPDSAACLFQLLEAMDWKQDINKKKKKDDKKIQVAILALCFIFYERTTFQQLS